MKKHTFRYLKTVQQISCTTGPCSTPTADAYVTATEPSEAMFTSNSSRVFIIHSAHASPSMLIPQSRLRSQGPALAGCCDCLSPALALAGCLPALETMSARPSELLCLWSPSIATKSASITNLSLSDTFLISWCRRDRSFADGIRQILCSCKRATISANEKQKQNILRRWRQITCQFVVTCWSNVITPITWRCTEWSKGHHLSFKQWLWESKR